MSEAPPNLLFLMSDEHLRDAAGCYGSQQVQTPSLDRLASRGTRFTQAYTPSPICVPARACLATGLYVHQNRFWSNAQPYDGSVQSWAHRLREAGHRVVSIGKNHYRSVEDDNGFDEEMHPMHVRDGLGWVRGLLRRDSPEWNKTADFAEQIGPGECEYTHYDRRVCDSACDWIRSQVPRHGRQPWALFVSFVSPHYPLIVPRQFYELYPLQQLGSAQPASRRSLHPVVERLKAFMNYDQHFDDHTRKVACASYYGLCSFLDDLIGRVLGALEDVNRVDDTNVIYTSDHGELLGRHGLWTKCVMYEESAAVPLLLSGPGIPAGEANDACVSLIDCYPTIIETAGLSLSGEEEALPGHSLARIASGEAPRRTILSEYHDGGSVTGMFMIRHGRWKYIHYPGYSPELYDCIDDPRETLDLGGSEAHRSVIEACETALRTVVDPDAANALAFGDQAQRIEALGGRDAILAMQDYDHTPVSADE